MRGLFNLFKTAVINRSEHSDAQNLYRCNGTESLIKKTMTNRRFKISKAKLPKFNRYVQTNVPGLRQIIANSMLILMIFSQRRPADKTLTGLGTNADAKKHTVYRTFLKILRYLEDTMSSPHHEHHEPSTSFNQTFARTQRCYFHHVLDLPM